MNNMLIHKILANESIVPFFRDFLNNHAEEWISHSKVVNKQVYMDTARMYGGLINSLEYVEDGSSGSDTPW